MDRTDRMLQIAQNEIELHRKSNDDSGLSRVELIFKFDDRGRVKWFWRTEEEHNA